jgi:hypothetical protein
MLGIEPHLADPTDSAIPRGGADGDEALALIRVYNEQWVRDRDSTDEPAGGSGIAVPQS